MHFYLELRAENENKISTMSPVQIWFKILSESALLKILSAVLLPTGRKPSFVLPLSMIFSAEEEGNEQTYSSKNAPHFSKER